MKKLIISSIFILHALWIKAQHADDFKWLAGTWKIETPKGIILESWHIENDSTLLGESLFITGEDSIPQEKIELKYRNAYWYYHPVLHGQNDLNPARFKVIFHKKEEFISEDPTHDFPQRITYRRIGNKLFASIEGKNKGKYQKQNFDFIRME